MRELIIRDATEHDLPGILEIYNDAIVNTTSVFQYDIHTIAMRKEWFDQKQKDGFPIFVADNHGEIIGFGTFGQFRNWQGYKYSVEHSIYVKESERNMGIGSSIMMTIINAAKAMNMHTLIAGIDAANKGSILFHTRFGFEEVGHIKQVGWKFERWLDLVFMPLMF